MSGTKPKPSPSFFLFRRPAVHSGRYPYIDALRAFAALSIVVFHFGGYASLPKNVEFLHPLLVRLGAGVLVFFVISGFLIYRPFVKANLAGSDRPETKDYAKRRMLRIVPAYFLALTVTAALVGKTDVFGSDGFLYYGFGQIYSKGMELKGLSVAWSLCIEVTLYAFLPVWAWLVAKVPANTVEERHRRERVTLFLLVVGGVAVRYLMSNSQGRAGSVSLLVYIDIFAVGMVMAYLSVLWEERGLPSWMKWLDDYPGIAWGLAAVAIWALATQTGPTKSAFQHAPEADLWFRHFLSALIGLLLLLPLAFGDQTKGMLRRALGSPLILWAGVVSYGLYLFHPVVLRKLSDADVIPASPALGAWLLLLLLVIAVTAVISAGSWHFLERPMLDLKTVPLFAKDRPQLENGPRWAIGVGSVALIAVGLMGTDYVFIDFVLILAGAIALHGVFSPSGKPRAATGALVTIGIIAGVAAIVPGILKLTAPQAATAQPSPFPQRAFVSGSVGGGTMTLFLNGKQVAQGPAPASMSPSLVPFEIGGVKGGHGWTGSIDSVAIWDRPVDKSEFQQQFKAGSSSTGAGLSPLLGSSQGLVRWYELGDSNKGAKDSKEGKTGKVVGTVGVVTGHVATGDRDGGSSKFTGTGRISTPPLVNVKPSSLSWSAWVQTGASVSDRVVLGVDGVWLVKTDTSGHWSFGMKNAGKRYVVTSPQTAQRFIPGAAAQAKAAQSKGGLSVPGLLAALILVAAGLFAYRPFRKWVMARFQPAVRK